MGGSVNLCSTHLPGFLPAPPAALRKHRMEGWRDGAPLDQTVFRPVDPCVNRRAAERRERARFSPSQPLFGGFSDGTGFPDGRHMIPRVLILVGLRD